MSVVTNSTSGRTGTGLKKCMPMTRSGRLVEMPSFMIGIDDVLDAENRIRVRHDRVELGEDFALDLLVFDDGLHDELAVRENLPDRR